MKICGRNIYNLRYADDAILLAESSDDLKWLLTKVKLQEAGPFLNIKSSKIMSTEELYNLDVNTEEIKFFTVFLYLCSFMNPNGDCS